MSVVNAKDRSPKSLRYNCWMMLPFLKSGQPAISTSTGAYLGLGLNMKFTHVVYTVLPAYTPGGAGALNVASGYVADSDIPGAPQSSFAWAKIASTFSLNDSITITVAGQPYTYQINSRSVGSLQKVMAGVAAMLNANAVFSASYLANSLGAELVVQTLAYSTATPAFAASVSSATGTISVSGATMTAGVAATLPTQPPPDQTAIGFVPSATAVAGNRLFPCDVVLPLFTAGHDGETGTIYARKNFDAIWPAASTMTAYLTNGADGATISTLLCGVPVDNAPTRPQDSNGIFVPSQFLF